MEDSHEGFDFNFRWIMEIELPVARGCWATASKREEEKGEGEARKVVV